MTEESERIQKDWESIPAKKPSTTKELTEKAKKYILEQAEEANGKPLDEKE